MENRVASALIAIRRIVRAAEFAARKLAATSGLTASQMVVLQIIGRTGRPSAGAIADQARLSQATVTALLDKLEEKGLIARSRDPGDRRRVTVALTPPGIDALSVRPDVLQNRFAERFEKLESWEQAAIIAALERVAVLMDAEGIDASPILDVGSLQRSAEP
ncbi:MAG: MarR family transcriptional regulator [Phenylobacterium sp.]|uniref:MarR family winged helix-turn-helix transcriptional regulator n=1 Tax=Phenylobacterium sp. TaxID=1871053 RepID=UPI0025CCA631|nr:MarR family transcriptional regulator [Phenylobacterium sp.]MBI1197060.1 MarR family transcriptional regulator [Phenylobacterium sp.]